MAVKRSAAAVAEVDHVQIRLPVAEPDPETYIFRESGHVDVTLRGDALPNFRRHHAGLIEQGAKLANGRPVSSKPDVFQYIFEQEAWSIH
jgi:hypothetical protein